LLISNEADVFPRRHPERSDLIDATIGEGSPFERSFGYYAHGVDESTSVLPRGWRDRLVRVENANTRSVRGWCLEVHDLAIAKHAAGREKDIEFTGVLAAHGMVRRETLLERAAQTEMPDGLRQRILARIARQFQR
jgi:hypothetical protein